MFCGYLQTRMRPTQSRTSRWKARGFRLCDGGGGRCFFKYIKKIPDEWHRVRRSFIKPENILRCINLSKEGTETEVPPIHIVQAIFITLGNNHKGADPLKRTKVNPPYWQSPQASIRVRSLRPRDFLLKSTGNAGALGHECDMPAIYDNIDPLSRDHPTVHLLCHIFFVVRTGIPFTKYRSKVCSAWPSWRKH